MSEKYKVRDQDKLYFITFATVYRLDLFTRVEYKNILTDSLKHCQENKGLELYAWVIMTNHVHLMARSAKGFLLEDIIRDYKNSLRWP
ncbi:MAG: hypothetical protein HC819_19715 [Cyclobacteriaceae bacterium]|nr:hypothetical protein [Cyclobacteriaceae bacterium]